VMVDLVRRVVDEVVMICIILYFLKLMVGQTFRIILKC